MPPNDSKKSRLLLKFLSFSVGPFGAAAVAFVATPIITWLVVPDEFGKSAMFVVAFNLLLLTSILGIDQSFVRFFDGKRLPESAALLKRSFCISLASCLVVSLSLAVFAPRVSRLLFGESNPFHAYILALAILFGLIDRYGMLVLRMKQRGLVFSALMFLNTASNALFSVLFCLTLGRNFESLILAHLLAFALSGTVSVLIERRFWFAAAGAGPPVTLRELLAYGLPIAPTAIAAWTFQSIDRFLLSDLAGYAALGVYTAAIKIVSVLQIFRTSFGMFWVPVSFEQFHKAPEDTAFFSRAFRLVSAFVFFLCLFILLFKDLIVLILGEEYRAAAAIMPFLLFGPAMYILSEVTTVGIYFQKKTYWNLVIFLTAAAVNVPSNLLLIPALGAKGAAIASCLSYVVFFTGRTLVSRAIYRVDYDLGRTYGAIVLIALLASYLAFSPYSLLHPLLVLAATALLLVLYRDTAAVMVSDGKEIWSGIRARYWPT